MAFQLLVLRHGKSIRGPEFATDFERPLALRGIKAAGRIGRLVRDLDLVPELIVTSPAVRALTTAKLVRKELGEVALVKDERIYSGYGEELVSLIQSLPTDRSKVMIVGHNPGFEDLVDELTGKDDTILKTCSLAILLGHSESWSMCVREGFQLTEVFHPRELPK